MPLSKPSANTGAVAAPATGTATNWLQITPGANTMSAANHIRLQIVAPDLNGPNDNAPRRQLMICALRPSATRNIAGKIGIPRPAG